MFTLTVILLIMMVIVYKTFVIVPMREAYVKERLGRFAGVLNPGLHFLIPFVDRLAYRHDTREQVLDVPAQMCITRDNIQVEVDGLVYIKVMSPDKASYGIENYKSAAINLAQTTMRSEIGKLTLDKTFSERDSINDNIVREIDIASEPWGIKVLRYEIRNINPSNTVIATLEKQMEAERTKRAEITKADAEKQNTINLSEGDRQEAINLSEGEMKRRMNVANGKAKAISIIAEASSKGIEIIGQAICQPGGDRAVQMRIIEQYLEQLGQILEKADVSVVPSQVASVKSFFEGLNHIETSIPETYRR